jgi:hypothetical protein
MSELTAAAVSELDSEQAAELSLLVELEARWENLRKPPARAQEGAASTQDLLSIQRAYDAFRGKLVAYNKRFRPAHVPELLLNTPSRLAAWCRSMRSLFLRVEHDPRAHLPVQLLEKAYRLAERMGARLDRDRPQRPTPPVTVEAAAQNLEALCRWCDGLGTCAGSPNPDPATAYPGAGHAHRE